MFVTGRSPVTYARITTREREGGGERSGPPPQQRSGAEQRGGGYPPSAVERRAHNELSNTTKRCARRIRRAQRHGPQGHVSAQRVRGVLSASSSTRAPTSARITTRSARGIRGFVARISALRQLSLCCSASSRVAVIVIVYCCCGRGECGLVGGFGFVRFLI